MVFTTGQWLGIAAFAAIVIAVGIALLKLDSMIGTNYDAGESDGIASVTRGSRPVVASPSESDPVPHTPPTVKRRRKHGR